MTSLRQPAASVTSPAAVTGQIIGELINLAGRQRMLSQRLVLHVLLAAHGDAAALTIARDCLATFTAAHADLVNGNDRLPGIFSAALRELYLGARGADARVHRFIALANDAIAALEGLRAVTHDDARIAALVGEATPFLDVLQEITLAYQHELRDVEAATQRRQNDIAERLGRISMQANIVAMNARVSAARAGDYGREFAVITTVLADIIKEMDQLIHSVVDERGGKRASASAAQLAHRQRNTTEPSSTRMTFTTSPFERHL